MPVLKEIRQNANTDIYMCGGGQFADWLLENEQIDILKTKVNPFLQGNGIKLFGDSEKQIQLELLENQQCGNGFFINTYALKY